MDISSNIETVTGAEIKPINQYTIFMHSAQACSLLCGPISPVVNLEMSSTVRFYDGNAIYGCSGLGNCRMLNFLSGAFFLIGLISMLIR